MTSSLQSLYSLEALSSHLACPLLEDERGVLALDFDQTLVQALPTLGDEHFYHFLKEQNRKRGLDADAHYKWTVKVRSKISYESCEPIHKINQLLSEFREKGWVVKVLTSRGEDMLQATAFHLKQAKLDLTLEDVIFKTRREDGSGALKKKDENLISWMRQYPKWFDGKNIRILFADDSARYCEEVSRVASAISQASVVCYHYLGAAPNPNLSDLQMKQVIVQLDSYKKGEEISCDWDAKRLEEAMCSLKLPGLTADTLYSAIMETAQSETDQ